MTAECIKVVIVDDEPLSRQLIHKLISNDPQLQLLAEFGDGNSAFAGIAALQPDLVFMDIQMPLLSGVEVIEQLVNREKVPYVIFITAFDQHAIKAFELGAIDYLVKPINKTRFALALTRAKQAIEQQQFFLLSQKIVALSERLRQLPPTAQSPQQQMMPSQTSYLTVFKGEQIKQLAFSAIIWIEALNQYLKIHGTDDTYILSENLSQISPKLSASEFVRVHRSSIINLNHLVSVSKKAYGSYLLKLSNGKELKLARGRIDLLPLLLAATAERG